MATKRTILIFKGEGPGKCSTAKDQCGPNRNDALYPCITNNCAVYYHGKKNVESLGEIERCKGFAIF